MPRLRNVSSGAVVTVPDEKAARLGSGWEPVEPAPASAPVPVRKPARRKTSGDPVQEDT